MKVYCVMFHKRRSRYQSSIGRRCTRHRARVETLRSFSIVKNGIVVSPPVLTPTHVYFRTDAVKNNGELCDFPFDNLCQNRKVVKITSDYNRGYFNFL